VGLAPKSKTPAVSAGASILAVVGDGGWGSARDVYERWIKGLVPKTSGCLFGPLDNGRPRLAPIRAHGKHRACNLIRIGGPAASMMRCRKGTRTSGRPVLRAVEPLTFRGLC
jgi:hypothetical protein